MATRVSVWGGLALLLLASCTDDDGGGVGGATATAGSGGIGGQGTGGAAGQAAGSTGGHGTGGAGGGAGGVPCPGYDDIVNSNVGFENGTFLGEWQLSSNNGEDCEMQVETTRARSGSYALHVTHSIQGSGNYNRCEVVSTEMFDPSAAYAGRFNWDTEYWLGYSIYLEDWTSDPASWNVLGQTHAVPFDHDWSCCSGPQFWEVTTSLDQFRVAYGVVADPYATPPCSGDYTYWETSLVAMQNKWIDIVIHFNASVGSDGFVQVWIDGTQVVDQQGSVLWAVDTCGRPRAEELVLQMGSYKSATNTADRSVYYDEVRVAGANGCYEAVAPRD